MGKILQPVSPVLFYCLTPPDFSFKDISDGDIHRSANASLTIDYHQKKDEELRDVPFF